MKTKTKPKKHLWDFGYQTIQELETEQGILASGKEEIYGCIFGRDSLITGLKLLRVYRKTGDVYFLNLVKKIIENIVTLQGKEINIESGEEPGKCIHEFRPDNHDRLTKRETNPWYVYPDNAMRNYDSVDSTSLLLMTIHQYYSLTKDKEFVTKLMPEIRAALYWILLYGDKDGDGFIDYKFNPDRTYGGLQTQSWMDSSQSVFHEDGTAITYPIAAVEVQAYTYVALSSWAEYFKNIKDDFSLDLNARAKNLKTLFNQKFPLVENNLWSLAFAIDGSGKQLTSARSSMGHVLWAVWQPEGQNSLDTILDQKHIPQLVKRLMQPDLFVPNAGLRTLSSNSSQFEPNSYHNGSIWPHDTSMVGEGLENFGYLKEANKIKRALLRAFSHFETPIEMFAYDADFQEFASPTGKRACKKQAWSAAALLSEIA